MSSRLRRAIGNAFRNRLLMQWVIGQLKRLGLDINPYYLIREGIQAHNMDSSNSAVDFSSAVLSPQDLPALAACTDWATLERLQDRLDRGHLCVVLKFGEQLAGYTWADFDEVNDAACDYDLRPDEAYLYDAFIVPEHRGRSLAPYMRLECYKHLRQAGRHTFYSISDYFNTPAIRFKQKLHAEKIRLYLRIKVGPYELWQWVLKDYA